MSKTKKAEVNVTSVVAKDENGVERVKIELDPYHNAPESTMQAPSKIDVEVGVLESSLNEILGLVDKITGTLQPVLTKKEVQGSSPRNPERQPELVSNLIEMNNIATEIKEKLKDLDVNIVL